jgi:hypothetical protein
LIHSTKISGGVVMLPRVKSAEYRGDYSVFLSFTNGRSGVVDLSADIAGDGSLFRQLQDPDYFARVAVDAQAGTIAWPNGVDLDPDVLYHRLTGEPLPAQLTLDPART